MKKIFQIIFISLCMVICLVPFAGMSFWMTESTTENKTLAAFPALLNEDGVNTDFLEELGTWFEDHFAFREALVNADALVMANVFDESNEDTVIKGEDGWLYYSATLDDYLGQNLMSERSIYNSAHNLKLMQRYVESSGAQFILAVAPNKNTLYGENMPYYDSVIVSEDSNWENLTKQLDQMGICYADLFALFENEEEVLYLKRDSHWNNKGALLVYNTLMDTLELTHENYETTSVLRTQTQIGDLGSMLYPLTAEPEWNYYYEYTSDYTYITETESVEDAWIITENDKQEGTLLMFRDSFGNSLLPFFAEAFGEACFSKGEPYALGRYMDTYEPDVVIVERVERNLSDFAENPPVMQGLEIEEELQISDELENGADCIVSVSENDTSYYMISGSLEESYCDVQTQVLIRLTGAEGTMTCEAFCVTTEESEYGYLLYVEVDELEELGGSEDSVQIEVLAGTEDEWIRLFETEFDFSDIH